MTNPVSLIIPVYNERRGIESTVQRVQALVEDLPAGSEAIFVNDGSSDGTGDLLSRAAEGFPPGLRLLEHRRNRGYGAALKTGIRAAHNELIAIADADGTYPLERLAEFAEKLIAEDAAMIVGARPVGQQPAVRRPAKAILKALAEYLTEERIPDLNSGFRVFRRTAFARHESLLPDGFSFTTTITMALLTEGEKVLFEPIRYKSRIGQSKIRPIRDTMNFTLLICRTTVAFNPLKVFGPAGLLLIALGAALLAARIFVPHGFGVATTITLLVGGLQVLALGLLADLINRRRG